MADAERAVRVAAGEAVLDGDLAVPAGASAVVVFAHGSGSSRHSPRNRRVAAALRDAGFATLLIDLLTPEEEQADLRTRAVRFDIPLLSGRVTAAIDWIGRTSDTAGLDVAVFGASTGAAAALVAAAERPRRVRAVVSRGGRPDLAGDALPHVDAPTLLVVGGADPAVGELNQQAASRLRGRVSVAVVPGATHLFQEPGALDTVCALAVDWLERFLRPGTRRPWPAQPEPGK